MAFNNGRTKVDPVYADIVVWQCSNCSCWSRKEYTFSENKPLCPVCNGEMHEETKNIEVIDNHS